MKLRTLLLVFIVALLGARLGAIDNWGTLARNPLDLFQPIVHAQFGQQYLGQAFVHTTRLTADFTDANASGAQNINGLQLTLPANTAMNYSFACNLGVTQATNVADNIGLSPSNPSNTALTEITAYASWSTGGAAVVIGAPTRFTATGNTNVVSFTPTVTTELQINVWGSIEMPAIGGDTIVQLTMTQGTAADVILAKRGSACTWIGNQ